MDLLYLLRTEDATSNQDAASLHSAASGADSDATVRDGCDLCLGTLLLEVNMRSIS